MRYPPGIAIAHPITDIGRSAQRIIEHAVDAVPMVNDTHALVGSLSRGDIVHAMIASRRCASGAKRTSPATRRSPRLHERKPMDDLPIRIYHNKRCSKSRAACQLIADAGASAEIIDYLQNPPGRDELRDLLGKLGMGPAQIVRRGEPVFREHYAGRSLTDEEWLDALLAHPILIERPIAVRGERAVVGRPPEKVLELLDPET